MAYISISRRLTKDIKYAEVLENTQFAFIATIHKLYSMPVIHSIAQKLGCIRPQSNTELSVHSGQQDNNSKQMEDKDADGSVYNQTDRASLSPQTLTNNTNDFGFAPPLPDINAAAKYPLQSPLISSFPAWLITGNLIRSQISTISPHVLSCPNPEVMIGVEDPMAYFTYDGEYIRQ
ncbi:hypothetical protein DER46DRAFT_621125 [Fusarium sp. MPI-SDFR-AT-0072]|nr:hypothetical protein DER46DRAFT_621125 [Fusarium sp. MPI-SDFR-AT-0072]